MLPDDVVLLSVLRCQLTYQGQVVTNAEAWFNIGLRPQRERERERERERGGGGTLHLK